MKKYEYVTISIGQLFGAQSKTHRELIDRYALLGYRYVGCIPTKINSNGILTEMDLVFEADC